MHQRHLQGSKNADLRLGDNIYNTIYLGKYLYAGERNAYQ